MSAAIDVLFCADRAVLPGLHVAARSLLDAVDPGVGAVRFHVFSHDLGSIEIESLRRTLAAAGRRFSLAPFSIELGAFAGLPTLNGSYATYFRLHAAERIEAERCLYLDVDTLCGIDVSQLWRFDLGEAPAALVPEATLADCIDHRVAERLGASTRDPYFNAGVMLFSPAVWRRENISARAMEFLASNSAEFHDQSALNVILHRRAMVLPAHFNLMTKHRRNWPLLCRGRGRVSALLHFLDYPKPWDFGGEFVHPFYSMWRDTLVRTDLHQFRSWHATPGRRLLWSGKRRVAYWRTFKDRILFSGYADGWLNRVKGVPVRAGHGVGAGREVIL